MTPNSAATSIPNQGMDLMSFLKDQRVLFDSAMDEVLQTSSASKSEKILEASHYSLFLPSKRIRPFFCLETCRALTGNDQAALPAAMALEMVHTYSLVHDDLPCMDNDDLRRGKPTNHKVFGEGTATLVGDALLTLAFETLATRGQVSNDIRVNWVRELSQASGMNGMVLGQQWDMEPVRESSVKALEDLHRKKTGALLAASVVMGAQAASAPTDIIETLREFALDMGLAFQIRDDVLDVIGGVDIGKPIKSDERNQKPTYVSVLGLEKAEKAADEWAMRALNKLRGLRLPHPSRLEELTRFVIERKV